MTKFFCDKCGEEIASNEIFTLKIAYNCPNGTSTFPKGFCYELCKNCIIQEIKHIKNIQREIKEG